MDVFLYRKHSAPIYGNYELTELTLSGEKKRIKLKVLLWNSTSQSSERQMQRGGHRACFMEVPHLAATEVGDIAHPATEAHPPSLPLSWMTFADTKKKPWGQFSPLLVILALFTFSIALFMHGDFFHTLSLVINITHFKIRVLRKEMSGSQILLMGASDA